MAPLNINKIYFGWAAEPLTGRQEIMEEIMSELNYGKIPGLEELDDAYFDLAMWHQEFNRSFDGEGGGGVGVRRRPQYDFDALEKAYPAAVAYRKAREESYKSNFELSAIGKKAMTMIEDNPENYQAALDYMDAEIDAFVDRHMWD